VQCWHKARCRKLGASVEAQAAVLPETETPAGAPREKMKLTLEQIGLRTVGGPRSAGQELSWLG